jgi:5-methyltetrahydropteroyltriglutamate--homocysteine methyltransferase
MTLKESVYAASLTKKPMKGMLTGPVTCLRWSFPRDDLPLQAQCQQLALAIRDEVTDLETAGISVIQIDEPALREGLPLRKADQPAYLSWAVDSFRLSTSSVRDVTQIHSHFCYSDFGEVFAALQALDADAITIESSKSDLKILRVLESRGYTSEIGPGVFDIHSPRVPSVEEMFQRIHAMCAYVRPDLLWVNPDCGLKTRGWTETKAALTNMVQAAKQARQNIKIEATAAAADSKSASAAASAAAASQSSV